MISTQVTLQVDVEDYDLKGNDFMGRLLGVLKGCGAFTSSHDAVGSFLS